MGKTFRRYDDDDYDYQDQKQDKLVKIQKSRKIAEKVYKDPTVDLYDEGKKFSYASFR